MLKKTLKLLAVIAFAGLIANNCYAKEPQHPRNFSVGDDYKTVTKDLKEIIPIDTEFLKNPNLKIIVTQDIPVVLSQEIKSTLFYFYNNTLVKMQADFKSPNCKEEVLKIMDKVNTTFRKQNPKKEKTELGEITVYAWTQPFIELTVTHTKLQSGKELLKLTSELKQEKK